MIILSNNAATVMLIAIDLKKKTKYKRMFAFLHSIYSLISGIWLNLILIPERVQIR